MVRPLRYSLRNRLLRRRIQLENDASAKEFKVIIKRIIQKRETATQKSESATQKGQFEDIDTTQKREIATQKEFGYYPKESIGVL